MSVQDRPLRRGWTTGTCAAAAAKAAYAALLTGEFPDPVVGKMTKLAQGLLDLHSKRGAVDLAALAALAAAAGGSAALRDRIAASNTAAEAFAQAAAEGVALGDEVARAAQATALDVIAGAGIALEVAVFDRDGGLVGRAPFAPAHERSPPRNRRR